MEWLQAKDTAQHPRVHRTGPKTKDYPAKVSVPKLRNPALACAFHGIFSTWYSHAICNIPFPFCLYSMLGSEVSCHISSNIKNSRLSPNLNHGLAVCP